MKKIEELMDNIEPSLLEKADVTEEELLEAENYVSLDRIEQLAIGKLNKPPHSIPVAQKNPIRKWGKKRIFILAATLLLTGTIFAETIGNFFHSYIGRYSTLPPEEKIQVIGESVTQKGIKMTVQEAYASSEKVMLILDFTKVDGTTFDKRDEIGYIKMSGGVSRPYEESSTSKKYLSEDGKTLTYIIVERLWGAYDGDEPYPIEIGNLVRRQEGSLDTDINIWELYQNTHSVVEIDEKEDISEQIDEVYRTFKRQKPQPMEGIPIVKHIPEIILEGMMTIEDTSYLVLKMPLPKAEYETYGVGESDVSIHLKNTYTGINYPNTITSRYLLEDEEAMLTLIECGDIDPQELKNAKCEGLYTKVDKVVEAKWEKEIVLEQDTKEYVTELNYLVENEGATYLIERARLSWMGIRLEGQRLVDDGYLEEDPMDRIHRRPAVDSILIEQKDGSKIDTKYASWEESTSGEITIDYRPVTSEEVLSGNALPAFINPKLVDTIQLFWSSENYKHNGSWEVIDTEDKQITARFGGYHDFLEGEGVVLLEELVIENERVDLTLQYIPQENSILDVERLFEENFLERRQIAVGAKVIDGLLQNTEKVKVYEYVYDHKPKVKTYDSGVQYITYRYEPTIMPDTDERVGIWEESLSDLAAVEVYYWNKE